MSNEEATPNNPPDVYDRIDANVRQILYVEEPLRSLEGIEAENKKAVYREFIDAYDDGSLIKCARIVGANGDLFLLEGRTQLESFYRLAKQQTTESREAQSAQSLGDQRAS